MQEIYGGHMIRICWNQKEMGYDFYIYDVFNREIAHSEMPYFYEENALGAAKETVRGLLKNTGSN